MSSEENPYLAPDADIRLAAIMGNPYEPSAKFVFLAWEELRLIYNAVLVLETLVFGGFLGFLGDPIFWAEAVAGAIGANFCFNAGPIVEGYLNLVGMKRAKARGIVFTLGLVFSILLTSGAIFFKVLKDFKGID